MENEISSEIMEMVNHKIKENSLPFSTPEKIEYKLDFDSVFVSFSFFLN